MTMEEGQVQRRFDDPGMRRLRLESIPASTRQLRAAYGRVHGRPLGSASPHARGPEPTVHLCRNLD
jgi:hypothetical protein